MWQSFRFSLFAVALGLSGGFACGSFIVCYGVAEVVVRVSSESPSPIGHKPRRPSLQVATSGDCDAPCNGYRFSELGGTR